VSEKTTTDSATISSQRVYNGRVINVDLDAVRFPNGKVGELEMVRHPGASAVVPFLSDPAGENPQVLLLRQYRYAAGRYIYEVPAGKLDGNEDPEVCARRELLEETGLESEAMEHLTTIYTTPGFTDERIHLFMAWGLNRRGEATLEHDEFVEPEPMTLSDALHMIATGKIVDAKTVCALLFVAGFRSGL
jgi:ADP-ribose pyrophosphatase